MSPTYIITIWYPDDSSTLIEEFVDLEEAKTRFKGLLNRSSGTRGYLTKVTTKKFYKTLYSHKS